MRPDICELKAYGLICGVCIKVYISFYPGTYMTLNALVSGGLVDGCMSVCAGVLNLVCSK